jgi:aminoglycoside 2''-phosphotransferase
LADHLDLVRAALPGVELRVVREIDSGWDFHVLDVNGQWIFRFPRWEGGVEQLKREVRLLAQLEGLLPIPVPRYEMAYVDCGWQDVFGVYRKLPGLPLFQVGPPDDPTAPARLGQFLAVLHALPPAEFEWLAPGLWREEYAERRHDVREGAAPLLEPEFAERLVSQWEAGIRLLEGVELRLVHRDLNGDNLLVNPQQGIVSGVIDWGDATLGDPAIDFGRVLLDCGDDFAARMRESYPAADGSLLARARFYALDSCCHEIGHGLEDGRQDWVDGGLEGLHELLQRPWARS